MRLAAAAAIVCGLASPALATEWVNCGDGSGEASFAYLAGAGLGVIQIAGMTITAGEQVWATDPAYGPGDPVQVGQAYEDEQIVLIDAVDPEFVPVAQLRLTKASEGDSYASGGTLRIPGYGAWAVTCEGP